MTSAEGPRTRTESRRIFDGGTVAYVGAIAAYRILPFNRRCFVGVLLVISLVFCSVITSAAGADVGSPSPSIGNAMNKPVANTVASLPLENQAGQPVTLDQFRGRAVLMVPFLTSCQEECPITTAALLSVQRAIRSDGLSKKVAIVEVTVDPGRDTPQRMTAYASLTGSNWTLLTGAPNVLGRVMALFRHLLPESSRRLPTRDRLGDPSSLHLRRQSLRWFCSPRRPSP